MPLHGAAIGPDAVLVWTGPRALTRFRGGARMTLSLPFAPRAARITGDGVRVVDVRGTIHRFTLAGERVAEVPLHTRVGKIEQAALAGHRDRVARLVDDQVDVYDDGAPLPWLPPRPDGYRELAVELSADGERLLVAHAELGMWWIPISTLSFEPA